MKGRCVGVSLFMYFSQYKNHNKIKKSLPGEKAFLNHFHTKGDGEAPQCTCQKGTLTVEAAVILPLFVCFFALLLFYFRMMQMQLIVQGALEETGRSLAILSAEELQESSENEIEYWALAKGMLYLKLKDYAVVEQYIKGGSLGISLLASEFDGDYILLKADYIMEFPVKLFGTENFLMCQKTRFRKWTGWHSVDKADAEEVLVYITENGEVYHMRKSCPYIDLSIQKISWIQLQEKRNYSGEIYDACELCGDEGNQKSMVYITNYGDRYHCLISCSGLKRTIYTKKLSEAGGMPACSKCSK